MAEPKKKLSRTRTHNRRAQYKIAGVTVTFCNHCHQPVLPHQVCSNCGYYKGQPTWKQTPTKRILADSPETKPAQ